jgi:hypothetical protein
MITDFHAKENAILSANKYPDPILIEEIKFELLEYKHQLDYNMTRFIDQYGHKLDIERADKYHKFLKVHNEEYAKITRLDNLMKVYNL